ncbi:MAG: PD-(D/E)XK nuclease family protein, partial [Bacteroidota bacterium]
TYDIGYFPLLNLIKKEEREFEFQLDEEEISVKQQAQLRGKIIHKCLSENVELDNLKDTVENLLAAEVVSELSKLTSSIVNDITRYYNSKTYFELNSFENYRNEYEVYCKEGEFFLYGIIDKLIIENDKLVIVDYKTDSVDKEKLLTRVENYITQLKFYSYVLSKLFTEVNNFELRLVFLEQPDELIELFLSKSQVAQYGSLICEAIKNIHTFNFLPNLEHCKYCQYALDGDICIKPN